MRAPARALLVGTAFALHAGAGWAQTAPPASTTGAAPPTATTGAAAPGGPVATAPSGASLGVPEISVNAYVEGRLLVDLDQLGSNGRTAVSGTLGGSASIRRQRVEGSLILRLTDRQEITGGSDNRFRVNGIGRIGAELLRDTIFFDGSASASVVNRDTAGNFVLDPEDELESRSERGNLAQTFALTATPSFQQRVGDVANVSGSYRVGYVTSDRRRGGTVGADGRLDPFRTSLSQNAQLSISNQPRGPLTVQLTGLYTNEDQSRLDRLFRSYSGTANLTYAINRRFSLLGSAGYSHYRSTRVGIAVGPQFLRSPIFVTNDPTNPDLYLEFDPLTGGAFDVAIPAGDYFILADRLNPVGRVDPGFDRLLNPVNVTSSLADPLLLLLDDPATPLGGDTPIFFGFGPVVDGNGNFVPDPNAPRSVLYEQDGLVWNAGARWTPGPRTFAELNVGQRFGSLTVTGSVRHRFARGWSASASLTDGIETFGTILTQVIDGVPRSFVTRGFNSGSLGGCVIGTDPSTGGCIDDQTQSLTSGVFRSRIGQARVSFNRRVTSASLTYTYSSREYLEDGATLAPGAPLIDPTLADRTDVSHRLSLRGSRRLTEADTLTATIRAAINANGLAGRSDSTAVGASLRYSREIDQRTRAFATLSTSRRFIDREFDDTSSRTNATLSVGVRRDLF